MALQGIKKLLDGFFTIKSRLVVPDYRKVQKEIDISRLFILTSFHALGASATGGELEKLAEDQRKLPFAEQEQQVQNNVHEQVRKICRALDTIFVSECDRKKALEEGFQKPSGLAFAVSRSKPDIEVQKLLGPPPTASLDKYDIDQALRNQLGFSLHLKESEIPGPLAGGGLFLEGVAKTGSVVAIYPGVVYSPSKYWYIPGYPKLDAESNPYLISRYEGYVIDGKSWGKGGRQREWWDGYEDEEEDDKEEAKGEEEEEEEEKEVEARGEGGEEGGEKTEEEVTSRELLKVKEEEDVDPLPASKLKIELIERRNPLALAHFVNHPPKGGQLPNVMICPYDFPEYEEDMRPYIPNLRFEDDVVMKMERRGLKWTKVELSDQLRASDRDPTVLRGIVLVTTRNVSNEELLLNYRLSNPKSKPSWYHSVDEVEERRRWAAQ